MADRKSITAALMRESGSTRRFASEPQEPQAPQESEAPRNPHYRPGRATKTNVTGFFPPEVKRQLRLIAAEHDETIQNLLAEALNDLFAKYGKAEIAPVEKRRD